MHCTKRYVSVHAIFFADSSNENQVTGVSYNVDKLRCVILFSDFATTFRESASWASRWATVGPNLFLLLFDQFCVRRYRPKLFQYEAR